MPVPELPDPLDVGTARTPRRNADAALSALRTWRPPPARVPTEPPFTFRADGCTPVLDLPDD
ncbi:hypothetical protein GCM10020367_22440 [Streptomyces sannanensis]|uniref:Uncharacterized protein n=1 Tax=Streptomyces sannanensis TaxID=285536 RepID=A0ABP6S9I4_9ACTN